MYRYMIECGQELQGEYREYRRFTTASELVHFARTAEARLHRDHYPNKFARRTGRNAEEGENNVAHF